jgi:hypothetical protein
LVDLRGDGSCIERCSPGSRQSMTSTPHVILHNQPYRFTDMMGFIAKYSIGDEE